jgi:opacity protein-like surface antigen
MKQLKISLLATSVATLFLCSSQAEPVSDGFYVNFQGGMALTGNRNYSTSSEAYVSSSPVSAQNISGSIRYPDSISGYDLAAALGYKVSPMRYEAEFTYLSQTNEFNNYTTYIRPTPGATNVQSKKMNEYGFRVMGNVYFDFDMLDFFLTPFVGVGVGYSYTHANFLAPGYLNYTFANSAGVNAFATQAIFGVKYPINESLSIDFTYRYNLSLKRTVSTPFDSVDNNLNNITVGQHTSFSTWSTNLLNLGLSYHFG